MNNVDNIEVLKFTSPFDLANWIKTNVPNEYRQEQLMYEGVQYKKIMHTHYEIRVELNARQRFLLRDIESFDLSTRALNTLKNMGVKTLGDLLTCQRPYPVMMSSMTAKEINALLELIPE